MSYERKRGGECVCDPAKQATERQNSVGVCCHERGSTLVILMVISEHHHKACVRWTIRPEHMRKHASPYARIRPHPCTSADTHRVCKWPVLRGSVLWGLPKWVIMCKWSCNDVLPCANVPIKCSRLRQSRVPKDSIMDTLSARWSLETEG